jgi:hypothetical protein
MASRKTVEARERDLNARMASLEALRATVPDLKIWVVSWNVGAAEPLPNRGRAPFQLAHFVPEGYDIYVVGLQEAMSDDLYDAFEQRLGLLSGISRLDLAHGPGSGSHSGSGGSGGGGSGADGRGSPSFRGSDFSSGSASTASDGPSLVWRGSDGGTVSSGPGGGSGSGSGSGGASGNSGEEANGGTKGRRPDYIFGRGDGSILSSKFTGLAVYARDSLLANGRVRVLRVASQSTARLTSKGGAAALLGLDGQTVAFLSCHLEAGNKFEERRAQYQEITYELGAKVRACVRGSLQPRRGFPAYIFSLAISLFASFASFRFSLIPP